MSACECCWADRYSFDTDRTESAYSKALQAHAERNCLCTKDTPEGYRARAGQFWDEERKVDTRDVKPKGGRNGS